MEASSVVRSGVTKLGTPDGIVFLVDMSHVAARVRAWGRNREQKVRADFTIVRMSIFPACSRATPLRID